MQKSYHFQWSTSIPVRNLPYIVLQVAIFCSRQHNYIIRKICKTVRNNAHVSNSLHTDNNISITESDHHHALTLPTAEKEQRYLHDQYRAKRP